MRPLYVTTAERIPQLEGEGKREMKLGCGCGLGIENGFIQAKVADCRIKL